MIAKWLCYLLLTVLIGRSHPLTEVIGGGGRIGSQFMRLLEEDGAAAMAVPRGICPGSLSSSSSSSSNPPIVFVCTPSSQWNPVWEHSVQPVDMVWIGNGLLPHTCDDDNSSTLVVPHYAIPNVGASAKVSGSGPPTFVYGKHAVVVQQLLARDHVPVEIVPCRFQIQIHAARKVLWATCLWLLCHAHSVTVSKVHQEYPHELRALVEELWPRFVEQISSTNNGRSDEKPTMDETIQYMEQYSNSIPTAIPSIALATAEWKDRNGLFLAPNQKRHVQLLERVVGAPTVEQWFKELNQSPSPKRPLQKIDLRDTVGCAVYGSRRSDGQPPKTAIVVGAGMVGSCVALHLLRQGLDHVTIIDENDSTTFGTTTPASWGWLNANQKEPPRYQQLNSLGMHAWRVDPLLKELPEWKGSLVHFERKLEPNEIDPAGFYAQPMGPLTRSQWSQLEPNANFAASDQGAVYHFPNEGCVDPKDAVLAVRKEAERLGAKNQWNLKVVNTIRSDCNTSTTVVCLGANKVEHRFEADVVVSAAGVGASQDALGGIPLLHRPGRIAFAKAKRPLSKILVDSVGKSHVLQRNDGAIVAGGGKLEFGGDKGTLSNVGLGQSHNDLLQCAETLIPDSLGDFVSSAEAVRPLPKDGFPCTGFVRDGLYSVVTHSGITLGPLLGALVACEITHSYDVSILSPYRPRRFL